MRTETTSGYAANCRPGLASFLHAISLDAVYEKALGDSLWRREGKNLTEVLDLVGGFGANLFGHHHPELVAEFRRLLDCHTPVHAQGSVRTGAARLAHALRDRTGDFIAIFTNSGTETIEAALKHAMLESPKRLFWAVSGAFHGKTLGSIQLTEKYCEAFADVGPHVRFLDPFDPSSWQATEAEADNVCAAFVEPVAGEGGIRALPDNFMEWLVKCRHKHGFPLIADEIQSGMGRTGSFLAIKRYHIEPDYICLSKSLGGGLAKIGALLIRRERFVEEFSIIHTSTFAEDDLSCLVALKALEIHKRDDLAARCEATGRWFLEELKSLCARYPEQLKEARGIGLMVGLELQDHLDSPSNGLQMMSQQNFLGYVAASYLLNVHKIRVAPTLSSPLTLRVEPSAYIRREGLQRFCRAIATMCEALENADLAHLTSFQVDRAALPIRDCRPRRPLHRELPQTSRRVGFVGHLIEPAHAALWDPSLSIFDEDELERYMARPSRILGPSLFDRINIQSVTGDQVHLNYYGLDLTPSQIMDSIRTRSHHWVLEKVEAAVQMAKDDGCGLVGLGGYTSIVSGNGHRIKTAGIGLTSGNSLTVASALEALVQAAVVQGIEVNEARMAVLGATGNIGSAFASLMAPRVAELLLVARDAGSPRLVWTMEEIRRKWPGAIVRATEDVLELRHCSLIVCASNSPEPIVFARHLSHGPAVICDLALPGDVALEVGKLCPQVMVLEGGVLQLPGTRDIRISGLSLESGQVYACIAETMLLGLEGKMEHGTFGNVTESGVLEMLALTGKHGFEIVCQQKFRTSELDESAAVQAGGRGFLAR
jgi:acetylornithine/succinyldiaminopimelate/putrescine aminotransferase/predicted amino acid dehydrogenase